MTEPPRSQSRVKIVVSRRLAADRDHISISIWSGGSTPDLQPVMRRFFCRRVPPFGPRIPAEVWYGGSLAGSVELPMTGGFARLSFVHAGARVDPARFSVRPDPEVVGLRVLIAIEARCDTGVEELASALWQKAESPLEPYPSYAEMQVLRKAFCRR